MTITHHLNEETLLSLAAGTLGDGLALVAQVHLQFCPHCRARLAAMEALGGAVLDAMPGDSLAPAAFTEVLARLEDAPATAPAPAPPRQAELGLPPGMALPPALGNCEIGGWQWFGPGIRYSRVVLPWAPAANVMFLRVAANRMVFRHTHGASELTQVLHGGYRDCTGQYGPGDMAEGDETLLHQPRADAQGCICLAALEGGLRLDGWLGRLQRRLGIGG
jgi:putative transcriptional regulator